MSLNLHLLRLFATVVQTGSFSRAADMLSISQPAISKGVRDFELQVGCRLLDRTRKGGLIFADNVVRGGGIADPDGSEDEVAQRTFHEYLAEEPRVSATTIQTVAAKGYDGFTLAVVL